MSSMKKISLTTILTVILIVLASSSVFALVLGQNEFNGAEYQSNIKYSFTRISLRYDYSCDENVYGLYLNLTNTDPKSVENLSVGVTNELCVGSIPPTPSALLPDHSITLYIYTTSANGTVSITGN